MAASYPSAIKSFTQQVDLSDVIDAADVNEAYDEIEAIQTELGTDPAGTATDVKTRLDQSLDGAGNLELGLISALTIASGGITITQNFHSISTESGDATDDLATISGGAEGFILVIRAGDPAKTVVVKDGTGNLLLAGDFTMDHDTDSLTLIRFNGSSWMELSRSNNAA